MMLVRTVIATVCVAALISPFVFADEGLSLKLAPESRLAAPRVRGRAHTEADETPVDSSDRWDVIVLKNGNRIEGWIVKEDDEKALLERHSSGRNRFYTAGISKTQIARIIRLAPEVREAQRQQRRAEKAAEAQAASQPRPNVAAQAQPQRAMGPRGNVSAARAAALAGATRASYGATPYSTGLGGGYGATGYGAAGYGGAGYGAGGYGAGGYGAGGFGGGAYGAGGYGGGYGGGFGGGGAVIFSNILQLCQPVDHRLVGEVEPVIGLGGQRASTTQTTVAGR
jgi:hypothetical protein